MSKKSKILIGVSGVACALLGFGVVAYIRARSMTGREACIQNLRAIDAAKQRWAFEQTNPSDGLPGTTKTLKRR